MNHRTPVVAAIAVVSLLFLIPAPSQAALLTTDLSVGSRGAEVTQLQLLLFQFGYSTAAPTGIYSDETAQSVRALQTKYGIEVTGIVGAGTRAVLNPFIVRNPTSTTVRPTIPTPSTAVSVSSGSLSVGSSGSAVTELQQKLAALGFFKETPTGYFGTLTRAALIAYQASNNLEQVGFVGPRTRALLDATPVTSSLVSGDSSIIVNNSATSPSLTFRVDKRSAPAGSAIRLTWSSKNATDCTAGNGWSGIKKTSGSETLVLSAESTYALVCTGAGGSVSKSVIVKITTRVEEAPRPAPAPTLTFTTTKETVVSGGSTTLEWRSNDATSCTATGDWTGQRAKSGSLAQTGITSAKSYTLTCVGDGGSISRTIGINLEVVAPPPPPPPAAPSAPTLTLTVDKTTVTSGGSAALTWSAANATSCTATGDWSGAKSTTGTQSQTGITAAKTYTLTCTGAGGSIVRTVTVAVEAVVTPPPSGSTVYSTPQLQAALAAAKGGETILLGAGTYAQFGLSRVKPASMVTIMSADSSNPVHIQGMELDDCANLTFRNIEVSINMRTMNQLNLTHSTNVHFDKLKLHDPVNKNRGAVLFRWDNNVSLKNSEVYDMAGLRIIATTDVTISGNDLHDLSGDGIQSSATSNIAIKNNTITDIYSGPGDHPDAIQFFTLNQTESARNIVITGNTYTRGGGNITQGIFMGNESGIRYQDVTISGNRIIGGMYNGIALGEVDRATISNNIVQGYEDMPSWIIIQKSTNSTLSNNRSTAYIHENQGNTNLTVSNNETIQAAPVGNTSILSRGPGRGAVAGVSTSYEEQLLILLAQLAATLHAIR